MSDITYLLHKGAYRFKALTQPAKLALAGILAIPDVLVDGEGAEIFLTNVKPGNLAEWVEELESRGLTTSDAAAPKAPPKPVTYEPGAAPWDV
jgi:hypothetical protein